MGGTFSPSCLLLEDRATLEFGLLEIEDDTSRIQFSTVHSGDTRRFWYPVWRKLTTMGV